MQLGLPSFELKIPGLVRRPQQWGEPLVGAADALGDALGVVAHVDGVGKQLTTDRPIRHDDRLTGVHRLIGGAHHGTGLGGQGHDHVGRPERLAVCAGVEEAGERHVGGSHVPELGSPADVPRHEELAPGHEGRGADHRFARLVGREAADTQDAQGSGPGPGIDGLLELSGGFVQLNCPSAPARDDVDPGLRGDRAAVDVPGQPSVNGLQPRREGIALRPETSGMAVQDHGAPQKSAAGENDEAGDQGGIGDHEAPRTTPRQVGHGVHGAQQVPDRSVGSPAGLGREEAVGFAAEGRGDLPGAATDRAPGHEGDGGSGPLPSVSVVVASRNRRHLLRAFVEAVAGDPAATEVVVVLDGDVDGSCMFLEVLRDEFPNLRPILAEQRGQMAALALGVDRCRGEVVLLMDDDVIAGPGLVSGHARHHADTRHLVVAGYMPVQPHADASPATRLYAEEYEGHCDRLESGELAVLDGLWLGNVSARRSDLLRVGVASDRFPVRWHADTDLGLRLQEAGARGVFDRRLEAAHLHAQATGPFLREAHERGEAAWLLQQEHCERHGDVRPEPMFEGLGYPARQMVSFLGREGRAQWSGRLLMTFGDWADRLGGSRLSLRAAQLSRRTLIVCGFRCQASRQEPRHAGTPMPVRQLSSSTKSARS